MSERKYAKLYFQTLIFFRKTHSPRETAGLVEVSLYRFKWLTQYEHKQYCLNSAQLF